MNFEISIPPVKIFLKEVFLQSLSYDLSKNLNFSKEWWIMQDLLNKNKNIYFFKIPQTFIKKN